MKLPETDASSLLQAIFEYLDGARIDYCVERNYDGYPKQLTGDVDLVVGDSDLVCAASGILRVARNIGWTCYQHHVWEKTAYLGLASNKFPNRFVLTIELFAGARWHGLPFLPAAPILKERSRHGDVTWKPHPAHQVIITSIHHLLYNGEIPEKYRPEILALVQSDTEKTVSELSGAFGKKIAAILVSQLAASQWDYFDTNLSRRLKATLAIRTLILNPIDFFRSIFLGAMANSRRPEGVVILVGLSGESCRQFCEMFLGICTMWHVFAPPLRYILDDSVQSGDDVRKLKRAVANGGVAIVSKRGLFKKATTATVLPVYEIHGEGNEIHIMCDNKLIAEYAGVDATLPADIEALAYQSLNGILVHRAISYRRFLIE